MGSRVIDEGGARLRLPQSGPSGNAFLFHPMLSLGVALSFYMSSSVVFPAISVWTLRKSKLHAHGRALVPFHCLLLDVVPKAGLKMDFMKDSLALLAFLPQTLTICFQKQSGRLSQLHPRDFAPADVLPPRSHL